MNSARLFEKAIATNPRNTSSETIRSGFSLRFTSSGNLRPVTMPSTSGSANTSNTNSRMPPGSSAISVR